MKCRICERESLPFGEARLLGKYDVQYCRCENCGFVQTEEPYWLEQAYRKVITDSDIGYARRNLNLSRAVRTVIFLYFDFRGRFLDYAGGYGLFTRMMRDAGMDFYHHDDYCENLFARAFQADLEKDGPYEMATALEVFEHFTDPLVEAGGILRYSPNLLFSTSLIPPERPGPGEWWYYGLEHGQHVSIYTEESLRILAEKLGRHLATDGKAVHLLTEKRVNPWLFRFLVRYKFAILLGMFLRRKSLLDSDFYDLTGFHLR